MSSFHKFATIIHARFEKMSKDELFETIDGHTLWDAYLAAFPEGTDPIYIERTEHDCSCCRQFVRNIGNAVTLSNGKVSSVWDVKDLDYPYDIVAKTLNDLVVNHEITNLYRKAEGIFGNKETKQLLEDGTVKRWKHFHGELSRAHNTGNVDQLRGGYRTSVQVFKRGLDELKSSAFDTVSELINGNSLYRGTEHSQSINDFKRIQLQYTKLTTDIEREKFIWEHASINSARFRNTVIGTLIQDLSNGEDLEAAVRSFESKVAPTNYKRPKALITQNMIQNAMKIINENGWESALKRRFAKIEDISVNNVLWVDNSVKNKMKEGGIEDLLMSSVRPASTKNQKAVDITIDEFMENILPTATSIDMHVKNDHMNNFMSLTAPEETHAENLFKWSNSFAWSYDGNITDSNIKDRVKAAGGNVTNAKMRVSLAWSNRDDLDIHIREPNDNRIYFGNQDGKLDVDMNAYGRSHPTEPVENVSWLRNQMIDGVYTVSVDQYHKRETSNVGCVIEIENDGNIVHLSYPRALQGEKKFANITVKSGIITNIKPMGGIEGGNISKDKWGIKTETKVPVDTVMFSPNYWDNNAVGNKHWFFILRGCKNEDTTRGIYNEFLNSSVDQHRKVFEVLGDKTKCMVTEDQLSGLGFSSTKNDTVLVSVAGSNGMRSYNINF